MNPSPFFEKKMNPSPFLSVIIPTYNGKDKLRKVLASLERQTCGPGLYEVLIVDDGSTDGTGEMVKQYMQGSPSSVLPVRYLYQENKGANAARNLGVNKAQGEIILFLGDDSIASPQLVEEHIKYHHQFKNIGVRGHVKPHPDFSQTCFERFFIEKNYRQEYRLLLSKRDNLSCLIHPFSTSNSSLSRRQIVEIGMFDEKFRGYGWQDVEFSHRLKIKGIRARFNPRAISYHYHKLDFSSFCQRMHRTGKSVLILARKYPAMKMIVGVNPLNAAMDFLFFPYKDSITLMRGMIAFAERHKMGRMLYLLYYLVTNHYFVRGIKEGRRECR